MEIFKENVESQEINLEAQIEEEKGKLGKNIEAVADELEKIEPENIPPEKRADFFDRLSTAVYSSMATVGLGAPVWSRGGIKMGGLAAVAGFAAGLWLEFGEDIKKKIGGKKRGWWQE